MTELVPFLLTWMFLSLGLSMVIMAIDATKNNDVSYVFTGIIIGGLLFTLAIIMGVQRG